MRQEPRAVLLFETGSRVRRVAFVGAVLVVYAAVMLSLAYSSAESYGLSPADGGELAPPATRFAVAGVIFILGIGPLLSMTLYASCYVTRIEFDESASMLTVRTALPGSRPKQLPPSNIERATSHSGRLQMRLSVDAPWIFLHVRGRFWPYVIDRQGRIVDKARWRRFGLG